MFLFKNNFLVNFKLRHWKPHVQRQGMLPVCELHYTVKILKFGTPQTTAIIVIKIEKFDVTLH